MKELEDRLRNIITTKCNTHGCKDCDLKNDFEGKDGCAATDLQNKITALELKSSK